MKITFAIKETIDSALRDLGLIHKVVKEHDGITCKVVGYFSDYFMAVEVLRCLKIVHPETGNAVPSKEAQGD